MRISILVLCLLVPGSIFGQNYSPLIMESNLARGDTTAAINYLRESLEKDPDIWQVRYNLGLLLYKTGEMASSGPEFLEAIRLNPSLTEARYFIGHYYFSMDSIELAIENFTSYLQIDNDNIEVLHYRAQAYMSVHNFFPAISDWTFIFNRTGEPTVLYNRALAYMGSNDHENARRDLMKVLELDPGNTNAYYYLGLSYSRTYDRRDALKWWKELLKLDAGDHRALYQLARDNAERGRKRKACQLYAEALENGYHPDDADEELFAICD